MKKVVKNNGHRPILLLVAALALSFLVSACSSSKCECESNKYRKYRYSNNK